MKCVACGKELEFGYGGECYCKNKACEYYYNTPHGMNSFGAQGEQWQARAEKAEAINKKIWEALCENCQYYCLFKCRYEKGDETCKGCVSTDSHTCPSAEYETCPIVAKEGK